MGPDRTVSVPEDMVDEVDAIHRNRVRNDLAIIQAQAQLVLRRTAAGRPVDPDDLHRRLELIVDTVRRLTMTLQR
jgi:hypothetical protein